jgi:hypothetical protein
MHRIVVEADSCRFEMSIEGVPSGVRVLANHPLIDRRLVLEKFRVGSCESGLE